jgi:hypothetical protein
VSLRGVSRRPPSRQFVSKPAQDARTFSVRIAFRYGHPLATQEKSDFSGLQNAIMNSANNQMIRCTGYLLAKTLENWFNVENIFTLAVSAAIT